MNIKISKNIEKPSAMETENGMIELNRLDEADVRHDRCPICKNKQLDRMEGFKVCPRCDTNFKVLDGKAYIIDTKGGRDLMSTGNRIINRLKKQAGVSDDLEKILKLADTTSRSKLVPILNNLVNKYEADYAKSENVSNEGFNDYVLDHLPDEDTVLNNIADVLITDANIPNNEGLKNEIVMSDDLIEILAEIICEEGTINFDDLQAEKDTNSENEMKEWDAENKQQNKEYWNDRL